MFCQRLLDTAEYKAYKHHFDTATALLLRAETWANEADSTASSADACLRVYTDFKLQDNKSKPQYNLK